MPGKGKKLIMPELPEVQTVITCLAPVMTGKVIERVVSLRSGTLRDLRQGAAPFGMVQRLSRRGKYIIIHTSSGVAVVVHLRMTGKLFWQVPSQRMKYVRARFDFTDGSQLFFDDVRTFGTIDILPPEELEKLNSRLGIEPLGKEFDGTKLRYILSKRVAPIKTLLLNQRVIAGLGNIYACEGLRAAGILPTRKASSLSLDEANRLAGAIQELLKKAILAGGTTVADYQSSDGKNGTFQKQLLVYKQRRCSCGEDVSVIRQAGRTTHYCKQCQN